LSAPLDETLELAAVDLSRHLIPSLVGRHPLEPILLRLDTFSLHQRNFRIVMWRTSTSAWVLEWVARTLRSRA
jgi:hypothetical protein